MNQRRQQDTDSGQESTLRTLVDRLPVAVYRTESAHPWRVSFVSEGVAALTGRAASEFHEHRVNWGDVVLADDLAAVQRERVEAAAQNAPYSLSYRVVHADGAVRWVEDSGRVVREADGGAPACLEGLVFDDTARKQAEAAFDESEARYRTAFNTSPDAININRLSDGLYLDVNDGFVREIGWSREELIGRTSTEFDIWADPADRRRLVAALASGGECLNLEAVFRRKDGGRLDGLMSARVIRYRGDSCILSVTRNISELKRAQDAGRRLEQQLLQTQKLESLGVLAGGIAHDFNNILMAVLGHAELALDELPLTSPARSSIAEIGTASRRAADLCRQMLAYSGRASFTLERINLRELIDEMVHLLKTTVSKKALLNVHIERNLPDIMADPSQIRQILMNLILNASEAIGERSGVIALSAGATRCDQDYLRATELVDDLAPGTYVHLEVADTGCGMAPDTRARIFEPFFTTKFSGRGLGLAAVLGIVRAHRGAIKVYSEPGKGTTFKVMFPAAEAAEEAPLTDHEVRLARWKGHGLALLADDEESLRALGARMLERLGFNVVTAVDGREAVEVFRARGPEIALVILDLTMPHLDGAEAFREIRRLDPAARVILASGYNQEDVAARFSGKPLAGVLQKPYTLGRMRELLSTLVPEEN